MRTDRPDARDRRQAPARGRGLGLRDQVGRRPRARRAIGAEGLRLFSRRGEEITARYPELEPLAGGARRPRGASSTARSSPSEPDGRPSFQLLQRRMGVTSPLTIARRAPETPVTFVAFDLLALDGEGSDRRAVRAAARAARRRSGSRASAGRRRATTSPTVRRCSRRRGGSGSRGSSPSASAAPTGPAPRSRDWVKVRIKRRGDFLIGGWLRRRRRPQRPARLAAARRLGRTRPRRPSGRAPAARLRGRRRQRPQRAHDRHARGAARAARTRSKPVRARRRAEARRIPRFVEPRLVCSVEFSEWTREATLRQPAFKGLRDDIDPATRRPRRLTDEFLPRAPVSTGRWIAQDRIPTHRHGGGTGTKLGKLTSMARAIWTGSISFGLLNVPVKLYSAVSSRSISFRELRDGDHSRDPPQAGRRGGRRGGPLREDRQGLRDRARAVRDPQPRRARGAGPEEDEGDPDRGLRRPRRDRPDLLRPALLPRPAARRRARLRAARQGDGASSARSRSRAS